MKDIAGFPPETAALIAVSSAVYFLIGWAPAIWPILATHKNRKLFPRRWLFVVTVLSLSYGLIVAALTLVTVPLTAYSVFIAPQLNASGFRGTDWLVQANGYVVDYWWLMLPIFLLFNTLYLVRKLKPAWPVICQALMANNSFKPNPHRGGA
jgi:hypothetical protein